LPDVRLEKVEALKPKVDDGTYHVESHEIAKRMVDESLRESARAKQAGEA
jgi:anti-sigma28 factor (negative regulator of flagellin synthesis)